MTVRRSSHFSFLMDQTTVNAIMQSLSSQEQFHRNITSLVRSTMSDAAPYSPKAVPGLKKIPPYWYPYTTMAKLRWLGRELLEVVSTEFRDRSMEYYVTFFILDRINTLTSRVLEICIGIRCHYNKWKDSCSRHNYPKRRSYRVTSNSI